jgi:hypothetical protein
LAHQEKRGKAPEQRVSCVRVGERRLSRACIRAEFLGAGSSSVEGDLELSVPVCSAPTLGLSRGLLERC